MSDYSDSTYDTSYDTSASYEPTYETTVYTPTYDTSYSAEPSTYTDAFDTTGYAETGSYSYDATDWSEVSEVSQGYMDDYSAETGISNTLYDMSTQAYLEGDSYAAYNLNQMSLDWGSAADTSWDTSNDVWTSMAETGTTTTWEPVADTSSYDTSWSASASDTSWSASSYDTSSTDSEW
jgi:hypothetical protein